MCKGWDEAPPRAAHRPPSSRFLTSSTALLPLGSSMLQLCRTRFVAFPTSSTRPSNLAAGSEFLPNDPPVRSLVWLPFDCVFPDTLTPLEECILPSAPSHHHRSGEPCSLRWLPSRSCAQRVLDCCIWRRSALFLKALIRGSDRTVEARIATGFRRFSSSMGFWFPFEAFVRLPMETTHPCDSRSRMLFAPAGVCSAVGLPVRSCFRSR